VILTGLLMTYVQLLTVHGQMTDVAPVPLRIVSVPCLTVARHPRTSVPPVEETVRSTTSCPLSTVHGKKTSFWALCLTDARLPMIDAVKWTDLWMIYVAQRSTAHLTICCYDQLSDQEMTDDWAVLPSYDDSL